MSLANSVWQDFATGRNVVETWVAHLYYDGESSSERLRISDRSYQSAVDTTPVHGFVTAWGVIRRSVDLLECVSSVSNLTIRLANDTYRGAPLADELAPGAGARDYLNRKVEVYSMLNGNYSSLMQVYHGRLRRVSWDSGEIELTIEPNQPWDFILIPTAKHPSGLWYPFAYGDFTENDSEVGDQSFCTSLALWPAPVSDFGRGRLNCLVHEDASGRTARLHLWEESIQQFVPVSDATPAFIDDPVQDDNGWFVQADSSLHEGVRGKCVARDHDDNGFANPDRAFDSPRASDTGTTYAGVTLTCNVSLGGGNYAGTADQHFDLPALNGTYYGDKAIKCYTANNWLGTVGSIALRLCNAGGLVDQVTLTNNSTDFVELTLPAASDDTTLYLQAYAISSTAGRQVVVALADVQIVADAKLDDAGDEQALQSNLGKIKQLYCSADGLERSWTTGAATLIHEMHRDLLYRVAGYTATPEGWSELDAARTGWPVRWWTGQKRVALRKVVEQAQKEGGFVFLWTPAGAGRYVFVKSSYTGGDLAATLQEGKDTGLVRRGHVDFDDLLTSMEVDYQRHPADEGRYLDRHTETNSASRTQWNIQSEENVGGVELEMLAGGADLWAAYFANIRSDLKWKASFDVLNHAHRVLEVADVVKFDDDSRYYMLVEESRSPGSLSFEAVEVGP